MKTLHLNLHKEWFDMILSGCKKEEYRQNTDFYHSKFNKVKSDNVKTITFSNGYAKNRRQFVIEISYISIREGLIEWGAEKGVVYYCIHLGKIISSNCA